MTENKIRKNVVVWLVINMVYGGIYDGRIIFIKIRLVSFYMKGSTRGSLILKEEVEVEKNSAEIDDEKEKNW